MKTKGRMPLKKFRRKWKNIIKMEVKEKGLDGLDRICLAQEGYEWREIFCKFVNDH